MDTPAGVAHPNYIGLSRSCPERAGVQNELRRVVDTLPGPGWTALPDGRIEFVNQRWCECTGLGIEQARGSGWQTAIHPDELPEFLERWKAILASGEPGELEARFRRSDGEYRRFLIRAIPVRDEKGNVVGWYGIEKSERQLRTIIDAIPTIAWRSLPDGSSEFKNQRWHDYTGVSPEAARGWAWQTVIHPEDLGAFMNTWRTHLAAGQAGEVEGRLRRFDGEYRWFLCRFEPLRDETGNIVNWYGTATDIDDRKQAEALLAGEKRLLEMVARGYSLPIVLDALCCLFEDTARGCYCSVVLLDPTGARLQHGAAPHLPASFNEAIQGRPVNVDSGPCAMAAYLNEQIIAADITSETRWEAYAWCPLALAHGLRACWSTPISPTSGKVIGTFAIYYSEPQTPTPLHQALIEQFTHIASIAIERTRSEEALKQSQASLAEAQRLSSTGSYRWNAVTDEIKWSEESYRIFEFDPAAPITVEQVFSRIHPDDLAGLHEQIKRARDGETEIQGEFRLLMPDSSVKYLQYYSHGNRDELGQLEFTGAIQDLTDRRRSEYALNKLRSELAHVARVMSLGALTASIAHEVNQPLSGIMTNASTCMRMLNSNPPDIDGARETARRPLRDSKRASEVIARLRSLFGKKSVTTELVDLNAATKEVVALSRNELQRNRVILQPELADDLPAVSGDRVQLQQVILNLLLNAAQAMSGVDDRPKQLMIKTEREQADRVRLSVQDVGVGFDPKDVDRLFEAFYTTKAAGMGVGLSVSRSIIESHHGRLWAALNDGPGATFSFSIPSARNDVKCSDELDAIQRSTASREQIERKG
jgi:PAS domain S-box-containing protein